MRRLDARDPHEPARFPAGLLRLQRLARERHLENLDAVVLAALRQDVLPPDLVDDVVDRAVELSGEQTTSLSGRREAL